EELQLKSQVAACHCQGFKCKRHFAMSSVSIEEAQANLPHLIAHLAPGEEVVITRNQQPVASLIAPAVRNLQPVFGRGRGKIEILSDDDEHLEHFKDYMP